MLTQDLTIIFERDLQKLKEELNAYSDEKLLWKTPGNVTNSTGNLGLHLCGNLKHFVGALLGNTGYVRERHKEFSTKDVPRTELLKMIDETREVVGRVLQTMKQDLLEKPFPGREETAAYWLVHLVIHFSYHLGQVNYHRRMMDA